MDDRRLDLHDQLKDALGSEKVYFQPPESVKLVYPCIVYSLSGNKVKFANGTAYKVNDEYSVTIITKTPDTLIRSNVQSIKNSKFVRYFVSDGLNHYVFKIFI